MERPIVNKKYLLEKYPGKGGWTFAVISEIAPDKRSRFGWVKVKGSIDNHEVKSYRLMPLGNGKLFFPVKAEIRKKIKKKAGDWVTITLFADHDPFEIPEEFMALLQDDPVAYDFFMKCTEGQKQAFVNWIYAAKTDTTKVARIAKTLDKLARGEKYA